MALRDVHHAAGPWARLVVFVVCRGYRAFLLALVAVALAPLVLGWSTYLVRSGSMEPSIGVGDVVVARPLPADTAPPVGRVMVFDNPSREGDLLVHRVIARNDDGTFTTGGDANPLPDSTPVERSAFHDRAVLLAPGIGLPAHWWQTRNLGALGLWLLLTVAAFVLAVDPERVRRRRGRHRGDPDAGQRASRPRATVRRWGLVAARVVGATAAVSLVLACAGSSAGASFTARTANGSLFWQAGTFQLPYVSSVLADDPYLLYLLDEHAGPWAEDRSGNRHTGRYTDISAFGRAGALPRNPGSSITPGNSGRVVPDDEAVAAPAQFTVELWFRTTSNAGGLLAGFENSRGDWSFRADRQVRIDSRGRVVYGDWAAPFNERHITSPKSYNDGQWHHVAVVGTGTGSSHKATVYVDGATVASGNASTASSYLGWWRIGSGTEFSPLLGIPSQVGFEGQLDNAAIYHRPLGSARIAAHYAAR